MTCLPLGLISNHLPLPSLSQPHCLPRVCLTSEVSFCFRAFVFAATSQAPSSFLCKLCSNVTSQRGLPRQPHLKKKKKTLSALTPVPLLSVPLSYFSSQHLITQLTTYIYLFVCLLECQLLGGHNFILFCSLQYPQHLSSVWDPAGA